MAAPEGIGSIAELGPGGAFAGRPIGLIPLLHYGGDLAGMAASAAVAHHQRKKAKDFNDQEADDILGTTPDGRKIKDK